MTTRCSRGGLTGLRLRRLITFLRRNGLSATAHTLELGLKAGDCIALPLLPSMTRHLTTKM